MTNIQWKLEDQVDDWVKSEFRRLGLENQKDYNVQSNYSIYMKDALKGAAKTEEKSNSGKPDFHIEKYPVPVIIEDKLHSKKHVNGTEDNVKLDEKSYKGYAVNEAIYYAQNMIKNDKYKEVIAIGISGDSEDNVKASVYYVFGSTAKPKLMEIYTTLDFLEDIVTFSIFLAEAQLTESEKHRILIESQAELQAHAKKLNKLMDNHSISVEQRVVYVSGMLLAMQDLVDKDKNKIKDGLVSDNLKGIQTEDDRDGVLVVNQIRSFLTNHDVKPEKANLMMGQFCNVISLDDARDKPIVLDKIVAKLFKKNASITSQIFTYIYENIYLAIDGTAGHLDIMGEMYSEFLKFALGDGKAIGIVLTPPYVTKMMTQLLDIDSDSKVMDIATGSAGFLIAAMEQMIQDAEYRYGRGTTKAIEVIKNIKEKQLLGVEKDAKMFTLAATNMILRGDGSSQIVKGNSFEIEEHLFSDFKPTKLLLNPPFQFEENGMPFMLLGLKNMPEGGKAAIIIQDSAGSGKAVMTNKKILMTNQLIASIKMPIDAFEPMASVQTSIYLFEHTGKEHDYDKNVTFIDFRNDGYKRAKRSISEIDHPIERYQDIIQFYKNGKGAAGLKAQWDLDQCVVVDRITDSGKDWNFEQHQVIDTMPSEEDFMKVVGDYLSWEVSQLLSITKVDDDKDSSPRHSVLDTESINGADND